MFSHTKAIRFISSITNIESIIRTTRYTDNPPSAMLSLSSSSNEMHNSAMSISSATKDSGLLVLHLSSPSRSMVRSFVHGGCD
mmetsp:Transcript_14328/g.33358  ORF Transcript_14328/g.33358 Transcript_14328/m.33358 type:complete len:83 (-) Transcript_14328:453-701(-)